MSFICGSCKQPVAHGVKTYNLIAETRPVVHSFFDSEGETVSRPGTEIVREVKLGPCCSGMPSTPKAKPDFTSYIVLAQSHHNHVKRCDGTVTFKKWDKFGKAEKVTEPCGVCKRIMESFATFPPQALSAALTERRS